MWKEGTSAKAKHIKTSLDLRDSSARVYFLDFFPQTAHSVTLNSPRPTSILVSSRSHH
jgi:hypothetical protein